MTIDATAAMDAIRTAPGKPISSTDRATYAKAAQMSLGVVGLGHVGAVSAACLAALGFRVIGVDVEPAKVEAIANGQSPISEPGLGELLSKGTASGRISATQDLAAAVGETDATLIMVGTPSRSDGTCDLSFVQEVSRGIGRALANSSRHHVIVLRCSVPPGTTLDVVVPILEQTSGKRLGSDFSIAFCPEFLREGAAIQDFFSCARTVIGASDPAAATLIQRIFAGIETNFVTASIPVAETVKYVDNVWHATKVAFANEVGRVCKQLGLDSYDVMDIFAQDTKLNISRAYLRPGFAFGGSCLSKDVRAFSRLAADHGVEIPLISNLIASNRAQVAEAVKLLAPFSGRKFAFLGITFKAGTDDVRESPILDVIASLLESGERVRVHDETWPPRNADGSLLSRPNGAEPSRSAERVAALAVDDAASLVAGSDVVVVGHASDFYRNVVAQRPAGVAVVDLARLFGKPPSDSNYQGISW